MADISPPEHLLANNGRGNRMVLAAKCTERHRKQPADKHISYYVNPAFLDLPAAKFLPQKWSDQRARSSYKSFAAGMKDIEEYDLAPTQMKKVIEPYLYLYAEMNTSINTIQSFLPQFSNESALGGRANKFLEKTRKRPGEISCLMNTKVGTAILLYMIQDQRFFSHALGPLPPFDTPKERKTWFSQILTEKPLLCVLFVFSLYRSSIDVPFIYSEWKYNDRLNRLKEDLQELIRLHLCELLELVFRAHFNLARTQLVVNTETYRTWITNNVETAFRSADIVKLQPELDDIPILHTWPKFKRPTPWWRLLGGAGNLEESDDEVDDEGYMPRPKKRGSGSNVASSRRKRARRGRA